MKVCSDIHGHQRINPADLGDALACPVAPSAGQSVHRIPSTSLAQQMVTVKRPTWWFDVMTCDVHIRCGFSTVTVNVTAAVTVDSWSPRPERHSNYGRNKFALLCPGGIKSWRCVVRWCSHMSEHICVNLSSSLSSSSAPRRIGWWQTEQTFNYVGLNHICWSQFKGLV